MWNGAGEPMISIFFPNPFIEADDSLASVPDFSRLATWRVLSARWLGRPPEALDAEGVMVSAFFFPVVPRGRARIRTQMNAALSREDLEFGLAAFGRAGKAVGVL